MSCQTTCECKGTCVWHCINYFIKEERVGCKGMEEAKNENKFIIKI